MRFALVLFLAILSFGVRPAKAQQLVVTGRLELSNGSEHSAGARPSPGGYQVELYADTVFVSLDKTSTDGSFTITNPFGIDPDLLRFSNVVCHQEGKYAHRQVGFRIENSRYVANVPNLKLLSTTEAKYSPEKAKETLQVVVHVEATLYRAGKGSFEIKSTGLTDAVRVLGTIPQAKRRAIVDSLVLDNLPSDVVDEFRKYRR